jgi:(R,R)-butanediol dehydrogenase/meso-butanediol dehydrogenase/diacetyl reductase
MKAVVFQGVGQPLGIQTVADPAPAEGEVVIKVARCGVCGTDIHATNGHGKIMAPGERFGHEFAGEVVAVGRGVQRFRLGDVISGFPCVGCGNCEYCATGIDFLCPQRVSCGQGLAEYCRVPERVAVKVPESVAPTDGALIEPLAVGRRAVRLLNPGPETRALVIGPGPIGIGVIFWLQQAGVRRIAVLASSTRRRFLVDAIGVEHFIVEGDDAEAEIRSALGGPPDMVFEAAGVQGVIARSIELVAPAGQIMGLGFCGKPETFIPAHAVAKDVAVRFSITYTREDFQECADALANRSDAERLRTMVTQVVSLDDFPGAFEPVRQGQPISGKLVCDPWL